MSISYRINKHKEGLIKQDTYDSDSNPILDDGSLENMSEYAEFRESRVLQDSTGCEQCKQLALPYKYYNDQPSSYVCQSCGYMFPNRELKLTPEDLESEDPLSDNNPNMNKRQYKHMIEVASDKKNRLRDPSDSRQQQIDNVKFAKNIDPIRDHIKETGRLILHDEVSTRSDTKIIDIIHNNPMEQQTYEFSDTKGNPIPHHPNELFLENQDYGRIEYSYISPPKEKITTDEHKLTTVVDRIMTKRKDIEDKTEEEVNSFLHALKR